MVEVKEYEIGSIERRIGAAFIDFLLIFIIWYGWTNADFNNVDNLLRNINPSDVGSLDIFAKAIIQMLVTFSFKWIFIQSAWYTLWPAIIGNGKTIGKLIFQLSVVDMKNLEELSPKSLVFREIVLRGLLETFLIIPLFISILMLIFKKESLSLHDIISKTIVIRK